MNAETIRRAAKAMRERAQAATRGPWFTYDGEPWAGDQQVALDYDAGRISDVEFNDAADPPLSLFHGDVVRKADGIHIASWHPTVALAVADWLDWIVDLKEQANLGWDMPADHPALAVARAFLGEAS